MRQLKNVIYISLIAISLHYVPAVIAEQAPVYEADNLPASFEGEVGSNLGAGEDLPPPPPFPATSSGEENKQLPLPPAPEAMQTAPEAMQSTPNLPGPQFAYNRSQGLGKRVARMEQIINNMQQTDSPGRVDTLQNEIQSLRGEVEQLTHQLQQMQDQQRQLIADLEKRFSSPGSVRSLKSGNPALAAAVPNASLNGSQSKVPEKLARKIATPSDTNKSNLTKSVQPATPQPNIAEEQQIYQSAYNLIKDKKYNDAVAILQKMLQKYPLGQFASNAHYWLGELYNLLGKNEQALNEFGTVLQSYADSPRVSDAQLKIGLIYASQLKWNDAKSSFKKVINHYPGTASSRLAAEQLKQIRLAGH